MKTKPVKGISQKKFMNVAIREANLGMNRNEGGPFGAVLVRQGKIIAKAHNRVIKTHDPTAHAEILTIRKASRSLKRFDLSDCEIYATCEPCPMCLAAILWAKIRRLYYGCTKVDAARISFDDYYIYQVLRGTAEKRRLKTVKLERHACLKLFKAWTKKKDRVQY